MSETTRMTVAEANQLRRQYSYILDLATPENDPDGTVGDFFKRLRKFIRNNSGGDPARIKTWFDTEVRKVAPLAGLTGAQIDAALEDVQPDKAADVQRELDKIRLDVQAVARDLGVDTSRIDFETIVDEARRNKWDVQDIRNRLEPEIPKQLGDPNADVMGSAGDYRAKLMEWAARNGLSIDEATANKYISNMAIGAQTLEDAKQDLRQTYLMGAYPAWSEKIRAGFDPSEIVQPYRQAAANLLELDPNDIGFDDPLIKQGMQSVGADGQPRVMPLYEFEQMVRNDERWQQTDNAYQTYTRVGTDLLRMFGFR